MMCCTDEDGVNELREAVESAVAEFHQTLKSDWRASLARRWLSRWGIKPETVDKWRLGYAPDEPDWILTKADGLFDVAALQNVGTFVFEPGADGVTWQT